MRAVVVLTLLALLVVCWVAQAQAPKTQAQSSPSANVPVKEEPRSARPSPPTGVEYVTAISELTKALAWPLLFAILVLTQRRSLARLLEALVELFQHSNRIKLGELIDVEIDRSAKNAAEHDVTKPEPTPQEIEAAARVSRIAGSTDLSDIRARLLEFAREYEATRSSMKPGAERTRVMNGIVAKMRTLAMAATPLLGELASDQTSPGKRLAALAILQLSPDLNYLKWLVDRIGVEQPFVFFHASLALLAMARSYGTQARSQLETAIKQSLDTVQSFSGGPPDRNTIDVLRTAQAELAAQSHRRARGSGATDNE